MSSQKRNRRAGDAAAITVSRSKSSACENTRQPPSTQACPRQRPGDLAARARPVYRLTLRAEPRVDGERALRALLKIALRRYGLRCTSLTRVRQ